MSLIAAHVRRGLAAGAVGGVAYAAYVHLVGNNLVAVAESYEAGAGDPGAAASLALAGAGVWGLLLGVAVLGLAYYFLEPAIPGRGVTRSYVAAAAGFLVVSGGPWLALPPQPPGVEATLPTATRQLVYVAMAVAALLAVALAAGGYRRAAPRSRAVAVLAAVGPLAALVALGVAVPVPPATGPAPPELSAAFRWSVVAGQVGLWLVMASVHAVLTDRARDADTTTGAIR